MNQLWGSGLNPSQAWCVCGVLFMKDWLSKPGPMWKPENLNIFLDYFCSDKTQESWKNERYYWHNRKATILMQHSGLVSVRRFEESVVWRCVFVHDFRIWCHLDLEEFPGSEKKEEALEEEDFLILSSNLSQWNVWKALNRKRTFVLFYWRTNICAFWLHLC